MYKTYSNSWKMVGVGQLMNCALDNRKNSDIALSSHNSIDRTIIFI